MKITDVKLQILENPAGKGRALKLVEVPNLRRIQYTHQGLPTDKPARQHFIQVFTDQGLQSRCTTTMSPAQVEILRHQVLDENPLHRERLFQMLHKNTH